MANWMTCEYSDVTLGPSLPKQALPINDEPVNLDYCYSFKRNDMPNEGTYQLVFLILKGEPIIWVFTNASLRDREYERAMKLIKQ